MTRQCNAHTPMKCAYSCCNNAHTAIQCAHSSCNNAMCTLILQLSHPPRQTMSVHGHIAGVSCSCMSRHECVYPMQHGVADVSCSCMLRHVTPCLCCVCLAAACYAMPQWPLTQSQVRGHSLAAACYAMPLTCDESVAAACYAMPLTSQVCLAGVSCSCMLRHASHSISIHCNSLNPHCLQHSHLPYVMLQHSHRMLQHSHLPYVMLQHSHRMLQHSHRMLQHSHLDIACCNKTKTSCISFVCNKTKPSCIISHTPYPTMQSTFLVLRSSDVAATLQRKKIKPQNSIHMRALQSAI